MIRLTRRRLMALAIASSVPWAAMPAAAQAAFPAKPITLVVPFASGSGTDVGARLYAQHLAMELNNPVVVDNRPGGTGSIGAEYVARAPADGHTLFYLGGGSLSQTFFSRKLGFELLRDLTPVAQLSHGELFLMVPADLPARNVQEFVEMLRKEPGKYNYASIVTTQMMPVEILKHRMQVQLAHVPYKSAGQVQQALESKDVVAIVGNQTGYENLFQRGKLRYLMAFGDQRNPVAPEVPSAAESGLAGLRAPFTLAVWAPAKTPAPVIATLNAASNAVLRKPQVAEFLRRQGGTVSGGAPQVHVDAMKAEHAYWAEAARISNFVPE